MDPQDDLEQEIRGLFNQSIEGVTGKDEVAHAYHIANQQRGLWDVAMMIGIGALSIFRVLLSPSVSLSEPRNNKITTGEEPHE